MASSPDSVSLYLVSTRPPFPSPPTHNPEPAAEGDGRAGNRHVLSILPLSHMLEQTGGLYLPLTYGGAVHYLASRQSTVIAKALRRYGAVVMVVVPQVLTLLLQRIEREARRRGRTARWERAHCLAPHLPPGLRRLLFRDVHRELGGRLRLFFCGGAHLPAEVASGLIAPHFEVAFNLPGGPFKLLD